MALKGLYFSLDAVMGLMLIGLAATLVVSNSSMSQGVTGDEIKFDNYNSQAADISYLINEEDFSALNKTYRDELITNTDLERQNTDSIAEALNVLHQEDESEAEQLAREYLNTFEYDSGLYIENEELVGVDASDQASSSFTVAGSERPKRFTVVVGE